MDKRKTLPCVEVKTSYARGPMVEELLATRAPGDLSSHASPDTNTTVVRLWVPVGVAVGDLAGQIKELLDRSADWLEAPVPTVRVHHVREEDWAETWKRHFHTQRVSRRVIIKPSWETVDASPEDIVLELDPGMSFGTGQHETTKACLQMMDDLAESLPPCPLLDAGCGSGILSMAAVRLGFRPVVAFDNDPQAVLVCQENLERAGLLDTVELWESDLSGFEADRPFPLVVANILAPILLANAETLVDLLARTDASRLILSGILDQQYADVCRCFEALGLLEDRRVKLGEWTSGCFRRSDARAAAE